jgi:multicomponent Na+:H+ antiporter subunit F
MMIAVLAALIISLALVLCRAIAGPTLFDRILAVNSCGTYAVIFIAVLSSFNGNSSYIDVALIYALINFISTIGFLRFFTHGHFNDH